MPDAAVPTSSAVPSVHEALADVMARVRHVSKSDFNAHHRFSFRGIDAVVNAVGPALRDAGVMVIPSVQSITYEPMTTSGQKDAMACRVLVEYRFYGPAGDSIPAVVPGEAWDFGDKATPKAMSVAFRTALLQALALPTDEMDPDAQSYEGRRREDPVLTAKNEVAAAWRAAHNGDLDADALRADYEQWAAAPLADATAPQLHDYASHLLDQTTKEKT